MVSGGWAIRTRPQSEADKLCDSRGQAVVIAERGRQFIDGHGVVFVDHRHRAVLQKPKDRVADVQVPRPVVEVLPREQNLGRAQVVLGEGLVPRQHQAGLARGRRGLKLGQGGWAFLDAEMPQPRTDGA